MGGCSIFLGNELNVITGAAMVRLLFTENGAFCANGLVDDSV